MRVYEYIYKIEVKGKIIDGKLTALDIKDFLIRLKSFMVIFLICIIK